MFDIAKERGSNRYYVCVGKVRIGPMLKDKKTAARKAATMNGMTLKEFMRVRKDHANT